MSFLVLGGLVVIDYMQRACRGDQLFQAIVGNLPVLTISTRYSNLFWNTSWGPHFYTLKKTFETGKFMPIA